MSDADDPVRPHVTLVLGAGGPTGRAFHAAVLGALADVAGWDARQADLIVGTSAGAQTAALLRAGWDAQRLLRHTARPPPLPLPRRSPPETRWPTSRRYLRAIAVRPWLARLGPMVAALLPEGGEHGPHLGETLQRLFPFHWPHRPLWIPALHVDSGSRVVFGREDAPLVEVATAVRCSSAVPGLRQPVDIGDARYVDGGLVSPTHADLAERAAAGERRRVVVVVSPMSTFVVMRLLLRWELRALVHRGVDVVLFEPDRAVAAAMGWNPFDSARSFAVADAAYRATRHRLERGDVARTLRLVVGARGDDPRKS
jgi:NTE family protein